MSYGLSRLQAECQIDETTPRFVLIYYEDADRLDTVDTLVNQDFDLDSAVLGPSGLGLIRCRCSVFAHGARRHDMPHWHLSFLHEISNDRFSSVLAQFRVHRSVAGRVGIARHLDDVSFKASGGVSQLLQLYLVLHRDL